MVNKGTPVVYLILISQVYFIEISIHKKICSPNSRRLEPYGIVDFYLLVVLLGGGTRFLPEFTEARGQGGNCLPGLSSRRHNYFARISGETPISPSPTGPSIFGGLRRGVSNSPAQIEPLTLCYLCVFVVFKLRDDLLLYL